MLRGIEQWIISLHAQQGRPAISPVRLPRFEGRHEELDSLWRILVDDGGSTMTLWSEHAAGKTSLAQEFAARAAGHFRDVLWVGCSDMSSVGIIGEVGAQLGAINPHAISDLVGGHRLLIVFDDLRVPLPVEIANGARSSVLITTRDHSVCTGQVLRIEPNQPAPQMRPSDPIERKLWHALSICRPHGVAISLPAMMAGIERNEANRAIERLIASGLADRLDPSRVRLTAESRDAARAEAEVETLRRKQAESVHTIFLAQAPDAEILVSELLPALQYACENDWRIARELGQRASDFLRRVYRHGEAIELLRLLLSAAKQRADAHTAELCEWELSWIDMGDDRVRQPIFDATRATEVQLRLVCTRLQYGQDGPAVAFDLLGAQSRDIQKFRYRLRLAAAEFHPTRRPAASTMASNRVLPAVCDRHSFIRDCNAASLAVSLPARFQGQDSLYAIAPSPMGVSTSHSTIRVSRHTRPQTPHDSHFGVSPK